MAFLPRNPRLTIGVVVVAIAAMVIAACGGAAEAPAAPRSARACSACSGSPRAGSTRTCSARGAGSTRTCSARGARGSPRDGPCSCGARSTAHSGDDDGGDHGAAQVWWHLAMGSPRKYQDGR